MSLPSWVENIQEVATEPAAFDLLRANPVAVVVRGMFESYLTISRRQRRSWVWHIYATAELMEQIGRTLFGSQWRSDQLYSPAEAPIDGVWLLRYAPYGPLLRNSSARDNFVAELILLGE